jgi:hypothetical protein
MNFCRKDVASAQMRKKLNTYKCSIDSFGFWKSLKLQKSAFRKIVRRSPVSRVNWLAATRLQKLLVRRNRGNTRTGFEENVLTGGRGANRR